MTVLLWSSVAALLLAFPETAEAQAGKNQLSLKLLLTALIGSWLILPNVLFSSFLTAVVNLSADGTRAPGGYVVPVGRDITFTCAHNGSSERSLFWDIFIANGSASWPPNTAYNLRDQQGLSSSASDNTDNPANITIHNLQLANNGSTVRCHFQANGPPIIILVEGIASDSVHHVNLKRSQEYIT